MYKLLWKKSLKLIQQPSFYRSSAQPILPRASTRVKVP